MEKKHDEYLLEYLQTLDKDIVKLNSSSLKETNDLIGLSFEHIIFETESKVFQTPQDKTLDINYLVITKRGLIRRHDFLFFLSGKVNPKLIWIEDGTQK